MDISEMQWNQTAGLLASTLKELRDLYARVYFADLGELPDEIGQGGIGQDTKLARREIPEKELFFDGLLGIYHGLNYAWATRHIDLKKAENEGGVFLKVCPPTDGVFAKLVPADLPGKDVTPQIGDKPVSLSTVRIDLQMAVRKLAALCYRLSVHSGVPIKIKRPKGLDAGAEEKPFDEAEFEARLFRVYSWLNEAWNGRFNNGWSQDPGTADKSCQYPTVVLSQD